jgi:hypothetical protein
MRNATRYSRVNGNTKYCTIRDSRAEGDTAEQVEIKLSNQTTPNSEPDCYTDNSTILNLKPTLTRDLVENGPKDRWKDPIRTIEIFRIKNEYVAFTLTPTFNSIFNRVPSALNPQRARRN